MNSEKDIRLATAKPLRSRFINVKVEVGEKGEPQIVLSGEYMTVAGFRPGDDIDAIVQDGLISILRLD